VIPWKTALVPDLTRLGVGVHCLGRGRRGGVLWPWRLRRLLSTGGYDVVHLHSPLVAGVGRLVVATTPRTRRPAVVSTEHNTWDGYALPTRLLNAWRHHKDAARWAVSRQVLDSVWPSRRDGMKVLVHGVVPDSLGTNPAQGAKVRAELGLGAGERVVCTVANLRTHKSYPDLLQAARLVLDSDPGARFIAVGQGPEEHRIRELHASLSLGDHFLLLGYRRDVGAVLAASDVFTLASSVEGYPIAVMEAMAAGLPVVATDVGGLPDAVQDGVHGLLVPAGRPDLLAQALLRVLRDDDQRQRMAEAAAARGRDFDMRPVVSTVQDAYAAVARPATAGAVRDRSAP
jgi:glycosyltransferase involved in cell wall biosynthesis